MDRSKETYEMIKKNIIFEEKLQYQRESRKPCLGCLVKSKYGDQSDNIEMLLYANRSARGPFVCLNIIDYERAEKIVETKRDIGGIPIRFQRTFYQFCLQPRFQEQREIFACETDELRNKWLKVLNESIEKLNTNANYSHHRYSKRIYEENSSEETEEHETKPPVPKRQNEPTPRPGVLHHIVQELGGVIEKNRSFTHLAVRKPHPLPLNEDDFMYSGTMEQLEKVFKDIDQSGVFAVMKKTKPDGNCIWAIRVYESRYELISSWNIYQNSKMNKYSLSDQPDTDPEFSTITELCSFYMNHDLPGEPIVTSRLTRPYHRL